MSAEIIPFDFEANAVRVVMIEDAPWWVAADVCRVLEISNTRDALSRLDEDERDGVGITDAIGRSQTMNVINESGFYKLVLTSRKPAAKRFTKWVTAEVLPALRTRGRYEMPAEEVGAADEISIERSRYIELLESENALLRAERRPKPKRAPARPRTDAENAEILRLIQAGLSAQKIAKLTGRSASLISMMRSGLRVVEGGRA